MAIEDNGSVVPNPNGGWDLVAVLRFRRDGEQLLVINTHRSRG